MAAAEVLTTIEAVGEDGVKLQTTDGVTTENQDPSKLIEVHQFLTGRTAVTGTNTNGGPISAWGMTRAARGVPPGAG